jgi:alpha-beta hydrolase superfamily lysophospholipase
MSRPAAASLVVLLAAAACADQATNPIANPYPTTGASLATATSSTLWRSVVTGETGPGSQYAFYVPNDWNGSVVYYAHGIRLPSAPVDLDVGDGFDGFRDALGARHYAVALSSFDENGFAVKDGAQRTHQLRGLFASQFGKPVRSYLAGISLGGLMVESIAESHGSQYDGTLAMCAPLGGSASEVKYLADVRVLFDWFYKGVLPGDVMNVPPGTNPDAAVGAAVAAIMRNPTGLGAMLRIDQTPIEGTNANEWVTSVAYAIKYNILALDNLMDHTHGHPFYDNSETRYSSSLPAPYGLDAGLIAALNGEVPGIAGVGRFTATPDALNYLDQYYKPSGALTIPTLTLHTTNDPFVPQRKHKAEFLDAVTRAGANSLLVQRVVPGDKFGHCTFKPDEITAAFDALTNWVENGVKPGA